MTLLNENEQNSILTHTLASLAGVKTVMEMLFMYDFVHGDLHPGNIMVFRNKDNELSMNLLDCGICVEMGESDHKNLINILGAFIKRDGLLAGKLMVDTAKVRREAAESISFIHSF